MVLRQSFVRVPIGIGIGLLASIGLARVLQGLLFGIKATDSLTFAVVAILNDIRVGGVPATGGARGECRTGCCAADGIKFDTSTRVAAPE
jgi:hypothetical protein